MQILYDLLFISSYYPGNNDKICVINYNKVYDIVIYNRMWKEFRGMLMSRFKIEHLQNKVNGLPEFSVEVNQDEITSIYSDVDLQLKLIDYLQKEKNIHTFQFEEGLYDRLTVEDNLKFFRKWFQCKLPISELLVMFDLQTCAHLPLKKCSPSELKRIYYAKYYLANETRNVFYDPVSSVNLKTINIFIQTLDRLIEEGKSVLILVASAEHALLLTNAAYHLRESGLHQLEIEEEDKPEALDKVSSPVVENMFKLPAKVDDKVILFDPTEIDYIESQSGKSFMYINKDAFALDLTLTEIEQKLELYGFYRCHRSYIVNLQKVREIITWSKNTYSLRINNKAQSTIPLSRTKLQTIQEIFKLK